MQLCNYLDAAMQLRKKENSYVECTVLSIIYNKQLHVVVMQASEFWDVAITISFVSEVLRPLPPSLWAHILQPVGAHFV